MFAASVALVLKLKLESTRRSRYLSAIVGRAQCLLSENPDQWPNTVRDILGLVRSQHSRAGQATASREVNLGGPR